MTTTHGTREQITWRVTVTDHRTSHSSSSSTLFGEAEDRARRNYELRAKYMPEGKTITLERVVTTEAWVQHESVVESRDGQVP